VLHYSARCSLTHIAAGCGGSRLWWLVMWSTAVDWPASPRRVERRRIGRSAARCRASAAVAASRSGVRPGLCRSARRVRAAHRSSTLTIPSRMARAPSAAFVERDDRRTRIWPAAAAGAHGRRAGLRAPHLQAGMDHVRSSMTAIKTSGVDCCAEMAIAPSIGWPAPQILWPHGDGGLILWRRPDHPNRFRCPPNG
jgi:hypothetical protein